MILSQILYQKTNERKSIVILVFGKKGDKLSAILNEAISKKEAEIIMKNNTKLDSYNLRNKILWAKNNIPSAYKKGYREFILKKITIQKSYSLTNKKQVK